MKKYNITNEDLAKVPYKLPDPNETYMMITASRGYGRRKGLEAYEATTKTK